MLLLTTVGRSTGKPHTVPLLYLRDGDDLIVVASWGGRPQNPEWYLNLTAEPTVSIQVGSGRWQTSATTIGTDERRSWWPRIVEAYKGYADYQARTDRQIPVVRLVGPS